MSRNVKSHEYQESHLVCSEFGAESRPGFVIPKPTEQHCPEAWAHRWKLKEDP